MLVAIKEDRFGWLHAHPVNVKTETRLRKERGDFDIKDARQRAAVLKDAFISVQGEAEQADFLGNITPARRKDLWNWGITVRMDEETVRAFAMMET